MPPAEANQPTPEVEETQATEPTQLEDSGEAEESSSSEWSNFVEDFDTEEVPEEPAVAEVSEPPAEEEPEQTPDDDSQAEEQPLAAEAQPQPPESSPPEGVQEQTEPTPPTTPEPSQAEAEPPQRSAEEMQKLRDQSLEALAAAYKLDDDLSAEFETNPTEALPRLAADLHLKVYEQAVHNIMSQLPQVVNGLLQQRQMAEQTVNSFFSKYEDLKPYEAQVTQVAQMWTEMNKGRQITPEQRQEEIAKFARAAVGLTGAPQPQAESSAAPPPPPPTPASPPVTSFQRPDSGNVFTEMAFELENDPDNY